MAEYELHNVPPKPHPKGGITVIVCGSHTAVHEVKVRKRLDALTTELNITHVITGGATGVDTMAHRWAVDHNLQTTVILAEWDVFGKAAGPKRNAQMLELKPDAVIHFAGGSGTANMVKQAQEAGVQLINAQLAVDLGRRITPPPRPNS